MNFQEQLHYRLYLVIKVTLRTTLKLLFNIKVEGLENIPKQGGVIIASNHLSVFDPPTVGTFATRIVTIMAKEELFKNPIIGGFLRFLYAFPVRRGASDRQAIRSALETLSKGNVLMIFPEGTRKSGGSLQKIERGIGFLALKSQVPIVPVHISGKYKLFQSVKIKYGKPFIVTKSQFTETQSQDGTGAASDIILTRMRELMEEN